MKQILFLTVAFICSVNTSFADLKPANRVKLPCTYFDPPGIVLEAKNVSTKILYYGPVGGAKYAYKVFYDKSNIKKCISADTELVVDFIVEKASAYYVFCHSLKTNAKLEIKIWTYKDINLQDNFVETFFYKPTTKELEAFFEVIEPDYVEIL